MSGFQITVDGRRIVATNGEERWQPESGQILFDFGVTDLARRVAPLARKAFRRATREPAAPLTAAGVVRVGVRSRGGRAARRPGRPTGAPCRWIRRIPTPTSTSGRLLHEGGDPPGAQEHYRLALATRPEDATAAFNMGVALEDLGREGDALAAYENAVALDPQNADAHYNAANLCERLGRPADALRHLKEYRVLTLGRPR